MNEMYGFNTQLPVNDMQNMRVNKLVITQTNSYNDMVIRPYNLDLKIEDKVKLENMVERKVKSGVTSVTGVEIANTLPSIMMPNVVPIAKADIVGGWRERRGRFWLEVVVPSNLNSNNEKVVYVQGFTDYWGVGRTAIDDNMKFYINSVIVVSRTFDHIAGRYRSRITDYYNIHYNQNNTTTITNDLHTLPKELFVGRPTDVLQIAGSKAMLSEDYLSNDITLASDNDPRLKPIVSDKTNNIPTNYIGETLSGLLKSETLTNVGYGANDTLINAAGTLGITTVFDIPFLKAISIMSGPRETSVFDLNMLKQIDPSLSKDKIIIITTSQMITDVPQMLQTSDSEDIAQPTIDNKLATTIIEAINAYMSKLALSNVVLNASNATGQPEVAVTSAMTFIEGLDPVPLANKLMELVASELYPIISMSNELLVEFIIHTEITGDTILSLSIGGKPPVVYRIPTFADSLFAPLLMDDRNLNNLAAGTKDIYDTVSLVTMETGSNTWFNSNMGW